MGKTEEGASLGFQEGVMQAGPISSRTQEPGKWHIRSDPKHDEYQEMTLEQCFACEP